MPLLRLSQHVCPRQALRVVACLAALVCASCGAPRSSLADMPAVESALPEGISRWSPPPVSRESEADFQRARHADGLGRAGDAVQILTAILERDPHMLEAHRLLQDLLVRSQADWWLRRRYAALLEARPESADALYLAARIEPDQQRQAEMFDAVVERDPAHPYAHVGVGLGFQREGDAVGALKAAHRAAALAPELDTPWLFMGLLALSRGESALAERFLGEAVRRDAMEPRAHLARAAAAERTAQHGAASEHALAALRVAPGDPQVIAAAVALIEAAGVPAHAAAAEQVLRDAAPHARDRRTVELARARCLLSIGHSEAARLAVRAARDAGAPLTECAAVQRRAEVLQERYRDAAATALAALPGEVLEAANRYADRWRALTERSAAADRAGATGRDLAHLAEAMVALGWRREAAVVFARARAADPDDRGIARRATEERSFDLLLRDLDRFARRLNDARRAETDAPGVREILAEVRRLSIARLGFDVTAGAVVRSYPLLGEFAASVASEDRFAREFDRRGLVLIAGDRRGEGPRLVLGRLVLVRADVEERVLGVPVTFDECWIEARDLPTDLAGLRHGLAGLTLDRLVFLQLDTILRAPPVLDPEIPLERRPAVTRADRLALDTPSSVALRIEASLGEDGSLATAALDAVRRHELGHVLDARRHLPMLQHPIRAARLFLGAGLDGALVEQTLEARAAVTALVDAREPRAALAALLSFLPETRGQSAHAAGYTRAVAAAVRLIADDPRSFPSLSADENVLQQMDRLSAAEIRELGRRLLAAPSRW